MKVSLVTIDSGCPQWFSSVSNEYEKKISRFVDFEIKRIKSKALARSQAGEKANWESKEILTKIDSSDFVILFDELGKSMDTQLFKKQLVERIEGGVRSIVFIVGGAFGASQELKQRANLTWKLSDLTMNHLIAQLVGLEQIYRALTIWKGVPYHNE